MRVGLMLLLATGLNIPAMAADVLVAPTSPVAPSAPGVIVVPGVGDAKRGIDKTARSKDRAKDVVANGDFGIAAHEQSRVDRNINKGERDFSSPVTEILR